LTGKNKYYVVEREKDVKFNDIACVFRRSEGKINQKKEEEEEEENIQIMAF
jgi:hypothetical protein